MFNVTFWLLTATIWAHHLMKTSSKLSKHCNLLLKWLHRMTNNKTLYYYSNYHNGEPQPFYGRYTCDKKVFVHAQFHAMSVFWDDMHALMLMVNILICFPGTPWITLQSRNRKLWLQVILLVLQCQENILFSHSRTKIIIWASWSNVEYPSYGNWPPHVVWLFFKRFIY